MPNFVSICPWCGCAIDLDAQATSRLRCSCCGQCCCASCVRPASAVLSDLHRVTLAERVRRYQEQS